MQTLTNRILAANALLSKNAVPHEGRRGRPYAEEGDDTRFPFQRDRDRIMHTNAFLRLQAKTQVFVAGEEWGDHVRTRLTHTLAVAQISRDLARVLQLNEDLAECIALAHDLGHPPFGHAGEAALNQWMETQGGSFEHNLQSFRIVTVLEKHSTKCAGLNLNGEVTDGILKHSAKHPLTKETIIHSLEAQLTDVADSIAYNSHDSDDGLTAGLFTQEELFSVPLARAAYEHTRVRGTAIRGALQDMMIHDLIKHSSLDPSHHTPVTFSPDMKRGIAELRQFLFDHMYNHPLVVAQTAEGKDIVLRLCEHYIRHPHEKITHLMERAASTPVEAVKDYVAGMTDTFAKLQASQIA